MQGSSRGRAQKEGSRRQGLIELEVARAQGRPRRSTALVRYPRWAPVGVSANGPMARQASQFTTQARPPLCQEVTAVLPGAAQWRHLRRVDRKLISWLSLPAVDLRGAALRRLPAA